MYRSTGFDTKLKLILKSFPVWISNLMSMNSKSVVLSLNCCLAIYIVEIILCLTLVINGDRKIST